MPSEISLHIPYHYDKGVEQRAINMREIERMLNDIINGDIPIGGSGSSSWDDWTPVLTTSAGSITTQSCSGRYATISGTIFYTALCQITDIGTGATELLMTLPADTTGARHVGSGKEVGVTGDAIVAYATNTTQATLTLSDGSFPGATGADFRLSGFYESA